MSHFGVAPVLCTLKMLYCLNLTYMLRQGRQCTWNLKNVDVNSPPMLTLIIYACHIHGSFPTQNFRHC